MYKGKVMGMNNTHLGNSSVSSVNIAAIPEVPADNKGLYVSPSVSLEDYKAENIAMQSIIAELQKKIANKDELLTQYSVFGTPEELKKLINKSTSTIEEYKNLGEVEDIQESVSKLRAYEALSDIDDFTSTIKRLAAYESVGTLDEIKELSAIAMDYSTLGTVNSIKTKLREAEEKNAKLGDKSVDELLSDSKELEEIKNSVNLEDVDKAADIIEEYMGSGTPTQVASKVQELDTAKEVLSKGELNTSKSDDNDDNDDNDDKEISLPKVAETYLKYKKLGTIREIKLACELLESYSELGTPEEIKADKEKLQSYEELGTPNQVKDAADALEDYSKLATLEDIKEACELLEEYAKIGTFQEIKEACKILESQVEQKEESILTVAKTEIANKYGLTNESVDNIYQQVGDINTVEKIFESINTNKVNNAKPQVVYNISESVPNKASTATLPVSTSKTVPVSAMNEGVENALQTFDLLMSKL